MFAGLSLLPWTRIIQAVAITAVVAGIAGLMWAGVKHLERIGEDRKEKELRPIIVKCDADRTQALAANAKIASDFTAYKNTVAEQAKGVADVVAADADAKARTKREIAALEAQRKLMQGTIDKLRATAKGPPAPTREASCASAAGILDTLAADLVRSR